MGAADAVGEHHSAAQDISLSCEEFQKNTLRVLAGVSALLPLPQVPAFHAEHHCHASVGRWLFVKLRQSLPPRSFASRTGALAGQHEGECVFSLSGEAVTKCIAWLPSKGCPLCSATK